MEKAMVLENMQVGVRYQWLGNPYINFELQIETAHWVLVFTQGQPSAEYTTTLELANGKDGIARTLKKRFKGSYDTYPLGTFMGTQETF